MENVINEPENRNNTGRNPDGTFKEGISGNPGGRPKNTLKSYLLRKFDKMSDEEKEQWLLDNKISGETQWKMAEGNPKQDTEVSNPDGNLKTIIINKYASNSQPTSETN